MFHTYVLSGREVEWFILTRCGGYFPERLAEEGDSSREGSSSGRCRDVQRSGGEQGCSSLHSPWVRAAILLLLLLSRAFTGIATELLWSFTIGRRLIAPRNLLDLQLQFGPADVHSFME